MWSALLAGVALSWCVCRTELWQSMRNVSGPGQQHHHHDRHHHDDILLLMVVVLRAGKLVTLLYVCLRSGWFCSGASVERRPARSRERRVPAYAVTPASVLE
jgi:hypothetical protein